MSSKAQLRTLIDPVKHVCGVFNRDLFCELAEDGTPFNNTHLVYVAGEYLGIVFRDFPDDPWRYGMRGTEPSRKCFDELPAAIAALHAAFIADQQAWQNWADQMMLTPVLTKTLIEDQAA